MIISDNIKGRSENKTKSDFGIAKWVFVNDNTARKEQKLEATRIDCLTNYEEGGTTIAFLNKYSAK